MASNLKKYIDKQDMLFNCFDVPIVLFVYNRPQLVAQVIDHVKEIKPKKILVIADGPNPLKSLDKGLCKEVYDVLNDMINWPCDIEWNSSSQNLGCGRRVSSGIDWAFSKVKEAIFLEDDCLPDKSFFQFCAELLDHYRDDERIGQICGSNAFSETVKLETSYCFSRYGPIWGWASWRRAWKSYDFSMKSWEQVRKTGFLRSVVKTKYEEKARIRLYDELVAGEIDTWDFQWGYAKMLNSMLSIIPAENLIKNIGFGSDATHTSSVTATQQTTKTLSFPLVHPSLILPNPNFDEAFSSSFAPSYQDRIRRKLRTIGNTLSLYKQKP